MTIHPDASEPKQRHTAGQEAVTDRSPVSTPQTDEQLYALYIEQQRRLRCPGCGEGDELF